MLEPDPRAGRQAGRRARRRARRRGQQGLVSQPGQRVAEPGGQGVPGNSRTRRRHRHLPGSSPGRGGDLPRPPQPSQFPQRLQQDLVGAPGSRQHQAHRGQCRLALNGVVLGGDVAESPHDHAAAVFRVPDLVEAARYPDPAPVAAGQRDGEAALAVGHQPLEGVLDHLVPLGVGLLIGPPRPVRRKGQVLRAEPQQAGEGGVDLHDGAVVVDQVKRLVQRVEQGRAPASVVAAQPGELHVGPNPGQQFGRGERLDEVVVRAGLQALDRRLLPGPGGQQQHRDLRRAQVRAQRRDQRKAAEAGHHHVADEDVRRVQPGGLQRGLPVGHGGDLVAGPQ